MLKYDINNKDNLEVVLKIQSIFLKHLVHNKIVKLSFNTLMGKGNIAVAH